MDEEQVRKMLAMSSCFAMDRTNGIANVCSTTPCACAASFVRLMERAAERCEQEQLWCIHSDATLCTFPDCECQRRPNRAVRSNQEGPVMDIVERLRHRHNSGCDADAGILLHAAAEIERLQELLRGVGANRYWEGRWRDEVKTNG